QTLYCEDIPLADIARREGTPSYVYSRAAILERFQAYDRSFGNVPHKVCYAVKANSNLSILKLLAEAGAGFDIVSGGELFRALQAGADPAGVIFSGVGKTAQEIDYALEHQIKSFNSESEPELALIDSLAARRGVKARVALRVNPDVDASTHPYISTGLREHKFGIHIGEAEAVYERARGYENLLLDGVSCHIGSQITDLAPMLEVFDKMIALVERLRARGLPIHTLDLGGGLGVAYKPGDRAVSICEFIQAMCLRTAGHNLEILIEPGRSIVADAGVLLTRVLYRKSNGNREFIIVDAAMNDLIRPSLYHAHHEIIPLRKTAGPAIKADVVGPVCESGDFLARGREMPNALPGDLLAVCTAGAYGFVAASNYNSRPRPPEILVEGAGYRVIRRRETYEDLVRGE
ncbi:MAG TPA: diaminopimelate decarboxylase, partial [Bryobacteraceae bacterium]|nr:diaminopimelate decarboxylase [Bryobacteraceae bacterium]